MLDGDNILNELFTPFYFLSPHLYVEMINEKFQNQCFQIFDFDAILEKHGNNTNKTNNLIFLRENEKKYKSIYI